MIDMGPYRTQEPWWAKKEPHAPLVALVREQYMAQAPRYNNMRRYASVYEYGWRASERLTVKARWIDETILAFNRAANAIDTLLSQVCAARILPICSTDGGTYDEQQLAEEASRALEGLFEEVEFDRLFEDMALDAASMSGTGFLKIYPDFDSCTVKVERIPPLDMVIDDRETRYSSNTPPRCMYQRIVMDRFMAADLYGEPDKELEGSAKSRREAILSAASASPGEDMDHDDALIEVFEGWRRPSREHVEEYDEPANDNDEDEEHEEKKRCDSGDGVHATCIDKVTLAKDDEGRFPFVWFTPLRPRIGFWGIPFMRRIAPAQRELELLDERIQVANKKMGGSHFLAPKSANISVRKFGNHKGDVLEYEGQMPPTEWAPTPVNPQTYDYRERLANDMLRFAGLSQMAARGEKPAGLNSGKAMLAYSDETSRYLGPWYRERERVVKRATVLMLDAIEELVERKPGLTARLRDGQGYRTIPWKRILEVRHKLVFKTTPINALTQNWIGRQQTIDSWFNSGAIDANRWRKLSEIPDLTAQNAADMAPEDLIEAQLSRMVRTGEYTGPEPFYVLEKAKSLASTFYCMCAEQGVSEPRLKLIRDFIADCDRLTMPPEAPPGPPGAPSPPAGGPGPEAMPPDMGGMPPDMMPPEMMGGPANDQGGMPPMVA